MHDDYLEIKLKQDPMTGKFLVSSIYTSVAKNIAKALFGEKWEKKLGLLPKSQKTASESIIVLWGLAKLNLASSQFKETGYPLEGTTDSDVHSELTRLVGQQTRNRDKDFVSDRDIPLLEHVFLPPSDGQQKYTGLLREIAARWECLHWICRCLVPWQDLFYASRNQDDAICEVAPSRIFLTKHNADQFFPNRMVVNGNLLPNQIKFLIDDEEIGEQELRQIVAKSFLPDKLSRHNLSYSVTLSPLSEKSAVDKTFVSQDKYWLCKTDLEFERHIVDIEDGTLRVGLAVSSNIHQTFGVKTTFYRELVQPFDDQDRSHFNEIFNKALVAAQDGQQASIQSIIGAIFDMDIEIAGKQIQLSDVEIDEKSKVVFLIGALPTVELTDRVKIRIRAAFPHPKSHKFFPFVIGETTQDTKFSFDFSLAGISGLKWLSFCKRNPDGSNVEIMRPTEESRRFELSHSGFSLHQGEGCVVFWD